MSRYLSQAVLIFFSFSLCGQTLPEKILFEHIPIPGTIHSALTEDVFQDPYGMLWIAKDALYRYNGRDFRKYDTILPDSGLFSSREITKLKWDERKNRLLVGTRNYGVLEYRYETDELRRLPNKDGVPIVTDIGTSNDEVWVTSFTSGFFKLRNDTLVKVHAFNELRSPTEMAKAGEALWIGCVNEVIVVQDSAVMRRIPLSGYNDYYPNTTRAGALMFDKTGNLWIGTEQDGVIVIDTATLKLVRKLSPQQPPFYNSITSIVQDHEGLVWITTRGGGLVVYSPSTNTFKATNKNDVEEGTLSGDNTTCAFVDRSGIVWVGSTGDLNKYDRNKIKFQHYYHDPRDRNSLSDDNIRNVYMDEKGLIYVATSGGYLNTIDRTKNIISSYKASVPDSKGLLIPLSIAPYSDDLLLIGSSEGVLQFDRKTKVFRRFPPLIAATSGKPVRQILKYGDEYLMQVRGILMVYNTTTGKISSYDKSDKVENASCITVDPQNRIWVGTRDGVAYSDDNRQSFKLVKLEHDQDRPDSSFFLTLSMQTIGNELWVNSFNNAIYIINLTIDPPRLTEKITTINGLPDNTVYASIPDNHDKIWITHNRGLSRYDAQTHQFVHFNVTEGLQDEEFNRFAFFKAPSGEILLGGINGLNVFHPDDIRLPAMDIAVKLVDLTSFPSRASSDKSTIHALIDGRDKVALPYDQNSIQFGFFIPDYHQPARHRIRYRLEPIDGSWIETERFSTEMYSNLHPGQYTFTVRILGPAGDESSDTVLVTIKAPYWQTWWFLSLTGLVCCFLVYSIIYSSVQSTKRERIRLEELLKVRTREIEQSREELENLNRKKDLIFSILSHDLRSPLTTLKGFLGLLIENSDSLSKSDLQKYATNIRNSVTTSLDLIDNTLFWSLSQTGNIQCNPTTVPLSPILEKVKGLYQLTAEKKHLTLSFPSPGEVALFADENMVYVLLRNLVSNAIKFTPEMNTIKVEVRVASGDVYIAVKDSGVGMTAEEIGKIFLFDNPMVKKGTSSEKGTGLGLILCKKFVEMNKGRLLIESKVGVGSTFTVVLPVAK